MLRYLRVAGLAASILAIAACGQASTPGTAASATPDTAYPGQTALQVLDQARAALSDVGAVRVEVSTTSSSLPSADLTGATGSTSSGETPVTASITIVNGAGAAGTVSMAGGTLKLVSVGDRTYTQMDPAILAQLGPIGTSLSTVLNGKWMEAGPEDLGGLAGNTSDLGAAASVSSLDSAFSALQNNIPADSTLTRVPGKSINGVQTTGVHYAGAGSAEDAAETSGTVYIASTGTPYPLAVERGSSRLTLSHWNEKVKITKPAASQVLKMSDLGLDGAMSSELAQQLAGG